MRDARVGVPHAERGIARAREEKLRVSRPRDLSALFCVGSIATSRLSTADLLSATRDPTILPRGLA